jgi:hypothetical protein
MCATGPDGPLNVVDSSGNISRAERFARAAAASRSTNLPPVARTSVKNELSFGLGCCEIVVEVGVGAAVATLVPAFILSPSAAATTVIPNVRKTARRANGFVDGM